MAGFDFGRIGSSISKFMDTDYIDIKRDTAGTLQELYSNIPCHVAYIGTDNPDPKTVDIKPIIQSLSIHCNLWVDIQNNDFIVAKKTGADGSLLATFSGRCGAPMVSQGRKKVIVQMDGTKVDGTTPLPPSKPVEITIQYICNGEAIQDQEIVNAEAESEFSYVAPAIDGYAVSQCYVDEVLQEGVDAYIADVGTQAHEIKFIYDVSIAPTGFRFLVSGLYTKDDGSLGNGYHLYKYIKINNIAVEDGIYTITCANVSFVHEDNGRSISIKQGTKLVLENDIYVRVKSIVEETADNITFEAEEFMPTIAEQNAYLCKWYG